MITLLDYGAGNVRSVRNAITKLGFEVQDVTSPEDILQADRLVFPGVGNFGNAIHILKERGYFEPLRQYLLADRPFLGICLGLQTLFEGSEEAPGVSGLGIIPGVVGKFDEKARSVPQIGWNGLNIRKASPLFNGYGGEKFYFVHSYRAMATAANNEWLLTTTDYGDEFISSVQKGQVMACQFHPEKSGEAGLNIFKNFLGAGDLAAGSGKVIPPTAPTRLAKRIIACLDVRTNDAGDLVVTKGDQYDVRDKGVVRNLGKPVDLARRYYEEGADEVTFLNITAFRDFPLKDQPMIEVLLRTSEEVFVPLTIGGGIREYKASDGVHYTSLDVAAEYFRSGADKISIGSDAVLTVEEYLKTGKATGMSSIEQISRVYGNQAVVISVDPRRVYVKSPDDTTHNTIKTASPGPDGKEYCWYQCTIKGGREGRDLDVMQLVTVCEKLGAGEILLNCMDKDGTNSGYDLELIQMVKEQVTIPVIASSGAGKVEHFSEVFKVTDVEAALAAGIFHRKEVPISDVKKHLLEEGIEIR